MPLTLTFDSDPIADAILAKINTVAGIGKFYDYERWTKEAAKLVTLYTTNAQSGTRVYGGFIEQRSIRERYLDIARAIIDITWGITSFMSLDDADESEILHRQQVGLIRDAFRNDDDLGGLIFSQILDEGAGAPPRGVQLDSMDKVLFAGVLCTRARCSLVTRSMPVYS